MSDRFERNTRTVMVLTFFSRITGLARDATLSRVFGSGELMSSLFFAFMIPNLFRRLFGEGALSAKGLCRRRFSPPTPSSIGPIPNSPVASPR